MRQMRIVKAVYRFFHSKVTGLTLILAMGALSLLGTLLAQAPAGVRADPQAYAGWLDDVRPRYRGWTDPLNTLGMFHVFSSVWFQAVSALLALSILACTSHRLPQLWQRSMRPHTHVTPGFYDHAELTARFRASGDAQSVSDRIAASLHDHHYRVLTDSKGPGQGLYADRFRFFPFGTAVAHVSMVVIILGVVVSATMGFKEEQFAVTIGTRVPVGNGTNLSVEAQSFTDRYYDDGRPMDYASDLAVYDGSTKVAEQQIRVNDPVRYDGVSIYQSYFGIAALMKITDSAGATVYSGGVPLQWSSDDGRKSLGKITLPDKGIVAYVVAPASGTVDPEIAAGQVRVDLYPAQGDTLMGTRILSQGEPTALGDLTFTFEREKQFTGLIVSRDPGALLVWIGSALMVGGLFATLFFRHRRLWVRLLDDGTGVDVWIASADRHDSAYETWFRRFVADLDADDTPADRARLVTGQNNA